jgi:hypothetical protein
MEYLKTYYSLEKHLEETVKYNPQFEILNAIWKLNKKNLSTALNNVNQYFPHYSLHDSSHSNTIISNIESFLGEDRIKRLSPTNTWLILMASFTHDLGMVVFQDLIERQWPSEDFQEFLNSICDWEDIDMKLSGELLIKVQRFTQGGQLEKLENFTTPIEIKNAVTLVVAEYMRRIHHKRSSEILKGIDKAFFDVARAFYSDQIPNRLLSLLGDIAYLHGVEFYEILKRLDHESNGISNDKINPRFIASLLRLGDLLDIDDGRFDTFTNGSFKLPETSLNHKKKHSSIKHFLITPNSIEITADCPNEQVFRLARSWFDWLSIEVDNLNKEWSNIAPVDLGGSAPRIPKGKIKVYFAGSSANEDLINLRFQMPTEKVFEILEGGSIYEKAEFTFIRELIQNGLDASKIQLWSDIENGTYDFVFRSHFAKNKLSHHEIIKNIKFPFDIPNGLLESYNIDLDVRWEDSTMGNLIVEVTDKGTGISNADLIRMTSKVGQSRKKDKKYLNMLTRMPFWMRPTGAFGVGLQSLFLIVDSFTVYTKFSGEVGKKITFRSAKKGKYSTVTEAFDFDQQGTKVQIIIPTTKFNDVFGSSFDWEIISNYDYFTDEFGDKYIHKIIHYIKSTLFKINNFNATVIGRNLSRAEIPSQINYTNEKLLNSNESIVCGINYTNEYVQFEFFESIIGSQFSLKFSHYGDFTDDYTGTRDTVKFYVRDIPVEDNRPHYIRLTHSSFTWNFMSDTSDKILSISREKFIKKYKNQLEKKFFMDVLPDALQIIATHFENNGLNDLISFFLNKQHLSVIYFKIILTLRSNNVHYNVDSSLLQENLPNHIITKYNNSVASMNEFLASKEFFLIILYDHIHDSNKKLKRKKEIVRNLKIFKDGDLIIFEQEHFYNYLDKNYTACEIIYFDLGFALKVRPAGKKIQPVNISQGNSNYWTNFFTRSHWQQRAWNYADSKYFQDLAVVNDYTTGFEDIPMYSDASIISPFTSIKQFKDLQEECSHALNNKTYDVVIVFLNDVIIKRYVTEPLIQWLIEKAVSREYTRTSESIIASYRKLIAEMLCNWDEEMWSKVRFY